MTLGVVEPKLQGNFIVRPVTMDDIEATVELLRMEDIEAYGTASLTVDELRVDWEEPSFNLAEQTLGVFTPEGKMVGWGEIFLRAIPVRPSVTGYTHPDYRNLGIGTLIGQWIIEKSHDVISKVPEDARVVLDTAILSSDTPSKDLITSLGFVNANRSWCRMLIEMTEPPAAPTLAEGITITTLAEMQDARKIYAAHLEAFADHRGFVPEDFETGFNRWQDHWTSDPLYDPTLWFIAMEGDEIAGYSLNRSQSWQVPEDAYVGTLGVRREYRKKGIGLALLLHTFGEFWKRDLKRVALFVDGSSLTGATRLYQKAGMHVDKAYDAYELELRPGRELSTQSVE